MYAVLTNFEFGIRWEVKQYNTINTVASPFTRPQPRVGSASTTIDGKVYLFSGRGGIELPWLQ